MSYISLSNLKPQDAQVFMPVDAPSGLIIATVTRTRDEDEDKGQSSNAVGKSKL